MWAREVGNKENRREDMKDAIREILKETKDTARDNQDVQTTLNQKVKDTKGLQQIRERQINERSLVVTTLEE